VTLTYTTVGGAEDEAGDGAGGDSGRGRRRRPLGERVIILKHKESLPEIVEEIEEALARGDEAELTEIVQELTEFGFGEPLFGFQMPQEISFRPEVELPPDTSLRDFVAAYNRWIDEDDEDVLRLLLS